MKYWSMLIRLLVLAASAGMSAPEPADALLDEVIAAHGGLDRFHALSGWRIVAERRISEGGAPVRERYVEYMSRTDGPIRTLLIKERPQATLVFGHDGVSGFALADGVERVGKDAEEEAYFRAHGEYYLRSLPFKWADPGVNVTTGGQDDDGAWLLEVHADEGVGPDADDVWVAVIDPETYLLREARLTHDGGRQITYRYSDHREVEGVMFGFRMEYWSGGEMTGDNVIRAFEANGDIDARLFTPAHHRR